MSSPGPTPASGETELAALLVQLERGEAIDHRTAPSRSGPQTRSLDDERAIRIRQGLRGHRDRHDVSFDHDWVDEAAGVVFCLATAPDAEAVSDAHREAHGLVPDAVHEVIVGE